jgi:hypothetical protein
MASSIEFDDAHMAAWHIGSYVVRTALAFGELTGASGQEVITAIAAGAQVMSLLGSETRPNMVHDGWHGAKILGTRSLSQVGGELRPEPIGRRPRSFLLGECGKWDTQRPNKRIHQRTARRRRARLAVTGLR